MKVLIIEVDIFTYRDRKPSLLFRVIESLLYFA